MRRFLPVVLMVVATSAFADAGAWRFKVLLDGRDIGLHSFTVDVREDRRTLESRVDFDVRLLGFSAYRYHHAATEQWRGDCLDSLSAATDDDGKKTAVSLKRQDGAASLTGPEGTQRIEGCVMTFAYWNPKILQAGRLLNPQTGKYETVRIVDLGTGTVDVHGDRVPARHYRIDGPEQPIELWYSTTGDWLGLDSKVGRRRLSYRLE